MTALPHGSRRGALSSRRAPALREALLNCGKLLVGARSVAVGHLQHHRSHLSGAPLLHQCLLLVPLGRIHRALLQAVGQHPRVGAGTLLYRAKDVFWGEPNIILLIEVCEEGFSLSSRKEFKGLRELPLYPLHLALLLLNEGVLEQQLVLLRLHILYITPEAQPVRRSQALPPYLSLP